MPYALKLVNDDIVRDHVDVERWLGCLALRYMMILFLSAEGVHDINNGQAA